jgi:catalase
MKLTTAFGAPVGNNQNIATAGERGPALLENIWSFENMQGIQGGLTHWHVRP